MSAELNLQTAIYDKLTNDSALMALITAVYDHVPQNAASEDDSAFPYVVIGDDNVDAWDTDTETGFEFVITIHTWSRYRGRKETKQVQGAIYDALNRQSLTVTGFTVLDVLFLESESFLDADGITRHGISEFNIKMEVA